MDTKNYIVRDLLKTGFFRNIEGPQGPDATLEISGELRTGHRFHFHMKDGTANLNITRAKLPASFAWSLIVLGAALVMVADLVTLESFFDLIGVAILAGFVSFWWADSNRVPVSLLSRSERLDDDGRKGKFPHRCTEFMTTWTGYFMARR